MSMTNGSENSHWLPLGVDTLYKCLNSMQFTKITEIVTISKRIIQKSFGTTGKLIYFAFHYFSSLNGNKLPSLIVNISVNFKRKMFKTILIVILYQVLIPVIFSDFLK